MKIMAKNRCEWKRRRLLYRILDEIFIYSNLNIKCIAVSQIKIMCVTVFFVLVIAILGLAGFFPIHPMTYQRSWIRRRQRMLGMAAEENESPEEKEKDQNDDE